jgi:phytoene desaturase
VIVVGAGVSGLACALHLRSAGLEITVLERDSAPGGRQDAALELEGYRFDTGPTHSISPEAVAAPLDAVGEKLRDWIDIVPLDPTCRAHYPDGTTLDVHPDLHRTAQGIRDLCGGAEARAFLRYTRLARFRVPAPAFLRDPRTLRLFGAQSLFGFPVVDTRWYPSGGASAVPRMLAAVADKHGVTIRYQTEIDRWEELGDRVVAVRTVDGERFPADAVVLPARRRERGASHLVLHLGSTARYSKIAHHNVHFGRAWQRSRHEVLVRGELMSDPTVLVSAPALTDPGMAPRDGQVYRIIVPVPNLGAAPVPWGPRATRTYTGEIMAFLEARGYLDLGATIRASHVVSPADWAAWGTAYGNHGTFVRTHGNVVFTGSGLQSGKLAAQRVVGVA